MPVAKRGVEDSDYRSGGLLLQQPHVASSAIPMLKEAGGGGEVDSGAPLPLKALAASSSVGCACLGSRQGQEGMWGTPTPCMHSAAQRLHWTRWNLPKHGGTAVITSGEYGREGIRLDGVAQAAPSWSTAASAPCRTAVTIRAPRAAYRSIAAIAVAARGGSCARRGRDGVKFTLRRTSSLASLAQRSRTTPGVHATRQTAATGAANAPPHCRCSSLPVLPVFFKQENKRPSTSARRGMTSQWPPRLMATPRALTRALRQLCLNHRSPHILLSGIVTGVGWRAYKRTLMQLLRHGRTPGAPPGPSGLLHSAALIPCSSSRKQQQSGPATRPARDGKWRRDSSR